MTSSLHILDYPEIFLAPVGFSSLYRTCLRSSPGVWVRTPVWAIWRWLRPVQCDAPCCMTHPWMCLCFEIATKSCRAVSSSDARATSFTFLLSPCLLVFRFAFIIRLAQIAVPCEHGYMFSLFVSWKRQKEFAVWVTWVRGRLQWLKSRPVITWDCLKVRCNL